ncbi:hypothetical protein T11_1343 [Trichinella zimbabwensis]|uniref:Uncharacterized protein n=1 Tax=Trichinella zimbabwensis TaxID=268475 RepID=A0A0V1I9W0_9BILA|nr:hypothetical protein T11_1343 [Trichinella zimbabwensis]
MQDMQTVRSQERAFKEEESALATHWHWVPNAGIVIGFCQAFRKFNGWKLRCLSSVFYIMADSAPTVEYGDANVHQTSCTLVRSDVPKQMSEWCRLLQIRKTHSTDYYPQCSGLVKGCNCTLLGTLSTMCSDSPEN